MKSCERLDGTRILQGPPPTVWLSSGTDGTNYSLVNRVVTAGGRTYD
ncbi:phage fiber-tail adaptor protein [Sinorhizobium chiapasense]